MKLSVPLAIVILVLSFASAAQDLPDKIRGYKVHKAKVQVVTSVDTTKGAPDGDAIVKIDAPRVTDVSLTGVTFEAVADLGVMPQSGRIDFLLFREFSVNGVALEIDEYTHSFDIKKGVAIKLPKPVHGFVSSLSIAKALYKEMVESTPTWHVTGTVFVFGKFKKFGFKIKRVVPVAVEFKVKNPLT